MIKIKLAAGSKYTSEVELQTIESLQRLLSGEDGYIIPAMFIGKQISTREIDAILLLPDALFLLDFKNWAGQRIEVEGINGSVRRLVNGLWEETNNLLPNYHYAARELAMRLKRERWLPVPLPIYSIMVFTSIGLATSPQVSFAGEDPNRPIPRDGVSACRIEQIPQLIAAFRAASRTAVSLNSLQQSTLEKVLLGNVRSPAQLEQRHIAGYVTTAEHHIDTFLGCKIYLGEGEIIQEPVWIKEYEQVLASHKQRGKREQLVLRHADILHRFPLHKNIVDYRTSVSTDLHLYIILSRKPGVFLSELLSEELLSYTTKADLQRIPFDMDARLQILGDLLNALEFLTQQPGFEQSAYCDLRPDNIFVQSTDSIPIAQLFNFDCTKFPGVTTNRDSLKEGLERSPSWGDYASPELLRYITSEQTTPGVPGDFAGDVSSDIFSWALIAWELLTGERAFPSAEAKLVGKRNPWPGHLAPQLQIASNTLALQAIQLIEACLEISPTSRPQLVTLRNHFAASQAAVPLDSFQQSNLSQADSFFGDYIISERIGQGGFGAVYKARHRFLNKTSCIKIIRSEDQTEELADLLLREAKILNALDNEHIVHLQDLTIRDNQIYLIMDYVDGGDLATILKNALDPLPLEKIDDIIQQIADGLHYAHQRQVIHRDLNPHNILLYKDERVVIADFGLAKVYDGVLSDSLSYAGTPAYMAPEHFEGKPGYASDLYSLGVIAYELLTNRRPFLSNFREGHCYLPPPSLRDLNAKLTPEIEQVILKMLSKNPQDRYQSAIEFARALHTAIFMMTVETHVNPENISSILPYLPDDHVIILGAGEYQGPFILKGRYHLIGSGEATTLYAVDEPVLHVCTSGLRLENMIIQRTHGSSGETVVQADKQIFYYLKHVTILGGFAEGASWEDTEWQLPIGDIDFGHIPIESQQGRTVHIEVKEWCTVDTTLQGLAVFPERLSPGSHILNLTFNASGKPSGISVNGSVSLQSETETREIGITGQIGPPPLPPTATSVEPFFFPPMEWAYVLWNEAAPPLLRELGSDEEKNLLVQWQADPRNQNLRQAMSHCASDLLFELAGRTAWLWYVRRLWIDEQNPEEECWELTLATDSSTFPQILTERKNTLCLKCKIHQGGREKLKITDAHFLKAEIGIKNLVSLPILVRLVPSVPGYTGIPQEFITQIQKVPIETHDEFDTDQFQDLDALLQSHQYRNAKVVLVGDSGVGKSGLALVLTGRRFIATESTHGRLVWRFDQQEVLQRDGLYETRETWLWDLAGQRDYRLIHQLHLHEATVALIVFDTARDADPFAGVRHWHRALRLAQQTQKSQKTSLTIFLVAARMDRGSGGMSHSRIKMLVQELGCAGYIETSAKDGRGIVELSQHIRATLDWTTLPIVTSTKLLKAIKTFVQQEQRAGHLLRTISQLYDAFLLTPDALMANDELRQQFEMALGRLDTLGDIRRLGFGDLVLLQPERLDSYASALIIAVQNEVDGLGVISEERVRRGEFTIPQEERLGDSTEEQFLLIAMIEELVSHELVLREGGSLLFPSQSTCEHPEYTTLMDKQVVIFTIDGPVLSIYTKLVVRLAQCGFFHKEGLWQHVVTYTTPLGETYGLLLFPRGDERAELGLFFDESTREEMRFYFEKFVHQHLEQYTKGKMQRKRRFVCTTCGWIFPEKHVQRRLDRGIEFICCSECDTRVVLIDGIERVKGFPALVAKMELAADAQREREIEVSKLVGKKITQDFDVFLCHNGQDKLAVREIYRKLKECGILPWLDEEELRPGLPWQRLLERQISQIKTAAIFVGKDGLGPWQYTEQEAFLREFVQRECPVIPVLLEDAPTQPDLPLFLQGLTWVDWRVQNPDPLRRLIWGITGERNRNQLDAPIL